MLCFMELPEDVGVRSKTILKDPTLCRYSDLEGHVRLLDLLMDGRASLELLLYILKDCIDIPFGV